MTSSAPANESTASIDALAAQTLLATWAQTGKPISRKYKAHTVSLGTDVYDKRTALGREFLNDLSECVLRYHSLDRYEREDDDIVRDLIHSVRRTLTISPKELLLYYNELVEDRQYLIKIAKANFKSIRGAGQPKMGHTKVRSVGRGLKEILWVPKGVHFGNEEKFLDVVGKKHWNIKVPNMVTRLDFGITHPASLSTEPLRKLDAFHGITEAAGLIGRDAMTEIDVHVTCGAQRTTAISRRDARSAAMRRAGPFSAMRVAARPRPFVLLTCAAVAAYAPVPARARCHICTGCSRHGQ